MVRHAHPAHQLLAALLVVITWTAVFTYGDWPNHKAKAATVVPYAQHLTNRPAVRPPLLLDNLTDFRHEHERLAFPAPPVVARERERTELASRSAFRPRIDDLVPVEYRTLILNVAAEFELDPRVLAAMAKYESNWDANEIGPAQDSGLMQIIPSTAQWIARKMGLTEYNILDPETNVRMGAWYLKTLLRQHNDLEKALIEYNGGSGALNHPRGWDPYKYASRVLSIRDTGSYVA